MNLNDFQQRAALTDEHRERVYPPHLLPTYLAGIGKEFGELQEAWYDMATKNGGRINEVYRERLITETMDVIWFAVCLLLLLGVSFNTAAVNLLAKLMKRNEQGSIYDRSLRDENQTDAPRETVADNTTDLLAR